MKRQSMTTLLGRSVLAAAVLALVAGSASAATYNLRTGTTSVDWGHGPVDAWGYALVSTDVPGVVADNQVRVPGPTIYVPAGQDLTINLENGLGEATSIVIQGQKLVGAPQFAAGRVTSFTDEADVFGSVAGNTVSYSWSAAEIEPGTYLYNSGSHPAKQVHMGLYGAVVVDADPLTSGCATGQHAAYPGVCYDRDIVVVYSEVDPALRNEAGSAKALNFKPKYFLVNGDPYGMTVLTDTVPATLNSRVLLRFVNAGLKSYVPTLLGEDLDWIAEDGNLYPHARRSYSGFLAAGKTMDAIWVPETFDRHPLFDRRLNLSYNGWPMGGMLAYLDSADTPVPVANAGDDQTQVPMFDINGDPTVVQLTGGPTTGVTYDWALVGFPSGSTASLSDTTAANPTFTLDVPGTYTAQLVVNDGTASSVPDTVTIFTNLPPVAVAAASSTAVDTGAVVQLFGGSYCAEGGPSVACVSDADCVASATDSCVVVSYDPDGDALTYAWTLNGSTAGLSDATAANPTFTAAVPGNYVAELTVSDAELATSDVVTVVASDPVNQPPIAGDDFFTVIWKTTDNVLVVLANDSDGDGIIDPASLAVVTQPMNGATAVPSAGNILYTPKNGFKGTDYFTYEICDDGGLCSEARVLVNVVK